MIKVAVIGLGRIGRVHLSTISQTEGMKVVAVSDINLQACEDIAKEYNISFFSTDYNEVIERKDVDAVWICSPSNLHFIQVSKTLENKKYVFCEKPLELSIEKIQSLIDKYQDLESRLMIGFNRRFDADFQELKKKILLIGKMTILKITSRDPAPPPNYREYSLSSGGIFKDMTIHDFDIARFIVGEEVEEVYATAEINYDDTIKGIDYDTAVITLKFKNGVICNIDNSRVSPYGYDQRIEVLGKDAMVSVGNYKNSQVTMSTKGSINSDTYKNFFMERYYNSYLKEASEFRNCVLQKKNFSVNVVDALKSLELAEACHESVKKKKVIRLGNIPNSKK